MNQTKPDQIKPSKQLSVMSYTIEIKLCLFSEFKVDCYCDG
jgi:hypothetical protein